MLPGLTEPKGAIDANQAEEVPLGQGPIQHASRPWIRLQGTPAMHWLRIGDKSQLFARASQGGAGGGSHLTNNAQAAGQPRRNTHGFYRDREK